MSDEGTAAVLPTTGHLLIEAILGHREEEPWKERLHHISHHGRLEVLKVKPSDITRRRFRGLTDAGTDCAVSLPRSVVLYDGAVLHLDHGRAVVLKVGEQQWLRLRPRDAADALELGYHAGNLHWRVRFSGADLEVALDGPADTYLERISGLIDERRVVLVS